MGELSDLFEVEFKETEKLKDRLGKLTGAEGRYQIEATSFFYDRKNVTPMLLDHFSLFYLAEVRESFKKTKKDGDDIRVDLVNKSLQIMGKEVFRIYSGQNKLTVKSDREIYNPPYSSIEKDLKECIKKVNTGLKSK